ncbi:MAG: NADH-quinone oxidoreductase subunit M [Candidatus Symbiobacter sp.]|nr:NADH-quinone oxidoreductase subunit M [Candidatus Symbiobacter sp.]
MFDGGLLSLITFLPLLGIAVILVAPLFLRADVKATAPASGDAHHAHQPNHAPHHVSWKSDFPRWVALITSGLVFLLSLLLWTGFDATLPGFQFEENHQWIQALGLRYHAGIDGISLFFVLLSTLLTPICILASWRSVTMRVRDYMIAFLLLEIMMVGMFAALNIVTFYVFFEGVLIPMFLIVGIWGGERRVYAAFKFFLYTLTGSVLMLLAILAMIHNAGTSDMVELLGYSFPVHWQYILWLAFFAAFAVKVPMWPFHTWLPDAHVEAPTAGSVILAGVLLKMGGYGFLRFSIPMFPIASAEFAPFIFTLSVVAIIYTSLVALAQKDMKKLIAYSSVAHMGFVTIGLFTLSSQGVQGAVLQMISHGLVSGALFLCVGVVYDRLHTREIARYGGIVKVMPKYAAIFMLFTFASIGLPLTSGFVGEILILVGAYQIHIILAALAALGVILGAAYALSLYRRVIFGKLDKADLQDLWDVSRREIALFVPLVILVLWMGIYPQSFLSPMQASIDKLVENYHVAIAQAEPADFIVQHQWAKWQQKPVLSQDPMVVAAASLSQSSLAPSNLSQSNLSQSNLSQSNLSPSPTRLPLSASIIAKPTDQD